MASYMARYRITMKGSRSGRSPQAVARSQAGSVGGHLLEPIHPQIHPYPLKRVLDDGGNAGLPGSRSPVQNHDPAGWTSLEHAFPPFARVWLTYLHTTNVPDWRNSLSEESSRLK